MRTPRLLCLHRAQWLETIADSTCEDPFECCLLTLSCDRNPQCLDQAQQVSSVLIQNAAKVFQGRTMQQQPESLLCCLV